MEWFKENFTGKLLTDVRKLTFCGDDGDPIYAKDLLKILTWFRENNSTVQFVIVTNGSYKTRAWWDELGTILNDKDHIHFSLDGWDQESNNIYRVNCDWQSIMLGVDSLKNTKAFKTWAAIAFKFNEDNIDHMRDTAKLLNFDSFQLTLSTKFNKNYPSYPVNDPLQPSDKYIATGRFTRTATPLSEKRWTDNCLDIFTKKFYNVDHGTEINYSVMHDWKQRTCTSMLKVNLNLVVGQGLRYEHNKDIFDYIDFENILTEVLDDRKWKKFFNDMSAVKECGGKCSAKKWTLEHATSW